MESALGAVPCRRGSGCAVLEGVAVTDVPAPNAHGVYEPSERIECPNPRRNWQGGPWAGIRLLEMPDGWRYSTETSFAMGGHCGPITTHCPAFASRGDAIEAAIATLRRRIRADDREGPAVLRWLDSLQPAQIDLFGIVA